MSGKLNLFLILPILIPFLTAIFTLIVRSHPTLQRQLSTAGAAGIFVSGLALLDSIMRHGIQAMQMGDWPAPFGITLIADLFSAMMVALTGLMGFAVGVYSLSSMDSRREAFGYHPLFHILLMGVSGAFLTCDIFNLYVWFEVMLIASFVLLALGGEREQLEGSIKYVTLNLMSSALFLAGVGIIYGVAGTLNMADLAVQLRQNPNPGLITTLGMLFLVAFGIKAAIFPLFFWLPASYHTPPVAVSAIFAGLLTKVGVYALIRVFSLFFLHEVTFTHRLILVISAFTMVTGVLGAVAQNDFRRILSFHIISQVGYEIFGLGLFTPIGLAGSIFFLAHHALAKANLFLVSGVAFHLRGTYQLKQLGGFYAAHPGLSFLFLVPALSLAGVPPLSGFWAKLILIKAGLASGEYFIVAVLLAVSLLTLFSMIKIWNEAFWKPAPETVQPEPLGGRPPIRLIFPIILLGAVTVAIGLSAGSLLSLATRAAEQLLNPAEYIAAAMGG